MTPLLTALLNLGVFCSGLDRRDDGDDAMDQDPENEFGSEDDFLDGEYYYEEDDDEEETDDEVST